MVQSDLVAGLSNRVVVPVASARDVPNVDRRMVPVVAVGDDTLHAVVPLITVLPERAIGSPILDASEHADDVVRAIDMLLSGV